MEKAVFLDRDGVIIEDVGYPHQRRQIKGNWLAVKFGQRAQDSDTAFFYSWSNSGWPGHISHNSCLNDCYAFSVPQSGSLLDGGTTAQPLGEIT